MTVKTDIEASWKSFWNRFKPFKFTIGDGYDYHCFVFPVEVKPFSDDDKKEPSVKAFRFTVYKFGDGIIAPESNHLNMYQADTLLSFDADGNAFIDDTKKEKFIESLTPRIKEDNENDEFYSLNDPVFWCCAGGNEDDRLNSKVSEASRLVSWYADHFVSDAKDEALSKKVFSSKVVDDILRQGVILNFLVEYMVSEVTDIDWRLSFIISNVGSEKLRHVPGRMKYVPDFFFPVSDKDKYDLFINGPAIKVVDDNGNERTVEPRKDFLRTYPMVAQTNTVEYLQEVMKKVDALEPVGQLHLRHSDGTLVALTKAKQKHIVGKFIPNLVSDMDDFIVALDHMNIDALPDLPDNPFFAEKNNISNFSELDAMNRCLALVHKIKEDYFFTDYWGDSCKSNNSILSMCINPNRKLTKTYADILKASEVSHYNCDADNIVRDISDVVNLFRTKVLIPAHVVFGKLSVDNALQSFYGVDANVIKNKVLTLFSHAGLVNLIKLSKRVHRFPNLFAYAANDEVSVANYIANKQGNIDRLERIKKQTTAIENDSMRKTAGLGYHADWVLWCDHGVEIDGYKILPIASERELKEEGDAMKNCVGWGGHAKRSSRGNCKIFTIRDHKFNRVATMAIKFDNMNQPVIEELRGYHNANASSEIESVGDKFVEYLKDNVLISDEKMTDITEEIKNPYKEDDSLPSLCGYVPDSEDKVLEAMKHWNEFLPREYRGDLKKLVEMSAS